MSYNQLTKFERARVETLYNQAESIRTIALYWRNSIIYHIEILRSLIKNTYNQFSRIS